MILEKLNEARAHIKASKIKKAGRNKFSEYDYFTPEQINQLVWEAEQATGLIHTFKLQRNEHGLHGILYITEIETGEYAEFIQATEIPAIKATNAAQQIGGAVTYTQRYMLMTAFDIADNSLDFDGKDNTKEQTKGKPPLQDERFNNLIEIIKQDKSKAAKAILQARANFTLNESQEMILMDWENNLK